MKRIIYSVNISFYTKKEGLISDLFLSNSKEDANKYFKDNINLFLKQIEDNEENISYKSILNNEAEIETKNKKILIQMQSSCI